MKRRSFLVWPIVAGLAGTLAGSSAQAQASSRTAGAAMSMPSSISLTDPMSREGSGTAWLPDSTPMFGKMFMQPGGDMLMIHGAAMPRYTNVGSKRGDRRFDTPNWFMGMYSHPLSADSQLGLRAMISLDPLTEGGYGYPLLYQTGETWHHVPLHDRQHPHDLFDELSATYSQKISGSRSAYLYLGYPGEPALGPPTYMHRLIAYDLADAPIGHHWQDATHVTFGVATAGLEITHNLKAEASSFTGREPDENRYNFDQPRFDSQSARLSWNPDARNALQVSYGFVKNPEGDGVSQHRTTASWIYNHALGTDSNFTTTLLWGQNDAAAGQGVSDSYLAEADYQHAKDTLFTRLERIQKSGAELVLPSPYDTNKKYWLGEWTFGLVHDLSHGKGIDTGLGAAVTLESSPSSLNVFYGSGTPLSFQVFLRFRPSRTDHNMSGEMAGMPMNTPHNRSGMSDNSMPGMTMQQPTPPAVAAPVKPDVSSPAIAAPVQPTPPTRPQATSPAKPQPPALMYITASVSPNPPKVGKSEMLTVAVTDAKGQPISTAKVTADVAMRSMDMGSAHPAFKSMGAGQYQASVRFTMAGPWQVTIHVKTPEGKLVTKVLDVQAGM